MFQTIDWFVLSQIERFCHWFQRLTGKTNFYLRGLCFFLLALVLLSTFFGLIPESLVGKSGYISVFVDEWPVVCWLAIIIGAIGSQIIWRLEEREAFERLSKGVANPWKVDRIARSLRLLYLVVTPLILFSLENEVYDRVTVVLFFLTTFLAACDPLPPCSSKIKDWIKSLGRKPAVVQTIT